MMEPFSAGRYVCELPYGRNLRPADPQVVLQEQKGTCSTKHALMRRLAIEQNFELSLMLGIYLMTGSNTRGVGEVLARHRLEGLPETHCYLRTGATRIDLTRRGNDRGSHSLSFLHEEEIDPNQITQYKAGVHRNFLEHWIAQSALSGFTLTDIWKIREECIAALSG